ncbi:MAG: hypothetical protein NXY57DRAFT_1043317 [Lentinula lateritia]|nr:MAG: hypothetical protein NXY57DRAFT_1043317 [Lentinula lateritia]
MVKKETRPRKVKKKIMPVASFDPATEWPASEIKPYGPFTVSLLPKDKFGTSTRKAIVRIYESDPPSSELESRSGSGFNLGALQALSQNIRAWRGGRIAQDLGNLQDSCHSERLAQQGDEIERKVTDSEADAMNTFVVVPVNRISSTIFSRVPTQFAVDGLWPHAEDVETEGFTAHALLKLLSHNPLAWASTEGYGLREGVDCVNVQLPDWTYKPVFAEGAERMLR